MTEKLKKNQDEQDGIDETSIRNTIAGLEADVQGLRDWQLDHERARGQVKHEILQKLTRINQLKKFIKNRFGVDLDNE